MNKPSPDMLPRGIERHGKKKSGAPANEPENKKDKKRRSHILRRLLKYLFKYWHLMILAIALTLVSNQLALLGPKYSGYAIDAIAKKSGVDFGAVWENVIRMLFCYVLSAVTAYLLAALMIKISQKVIYTMRQQLFDKLTTLPVRYFDRTTVGDIVSRVSYDIDTVNASLSNDLVQVMATLYTVAGSFIFMWNISKPLIFILVVTIPSSILFTRYRSRRVRPLFRERSRKMGELNGYAEEMLSGCPTIRAYHREAQVGNDFNMKNSDTMDAFYKAEYYGALLGPSLNMISNVSVALIMILGGILYMYSMTGRVGETSVFYLTLGGISQFVQYSKRFAGPINEFANMLHEFQSAFSAAERVFRVLDEEPEKEDALDAAALGSVRGEVGFSDVRFGYMPEKEILHGISLHASPGGTIAIVGPTGAGKSTIINLLMRFYDPTSGVISVDGKPILSLQRASMRRAYTMVLQDTWLFEGSVYENIAYGKEGATMEEVISAAKAARIHSYIEHLPDGYETVLTDGGANISKGQKQLLTIARAMLSDAPMLILDEATSNVDSRTEILIQKALAELMKGRTSFIIAHRLSTIQNADCILVLQDGRITERGNHDELMRQGGFYSRLYNAQFD